MQPAVDTRLIAVIKALSFCRDVNGVMGVVRSHARDLIGSDGVTFVLREGDQCHYAEENAIAPLWKGKRFPMSVSISGWVMLQKQHVVIEDIYSDSRIPVDKYRSTFVKSLAMVPVRIEEPIAAIGSYWGVRYLASAAQLEILQIIADAAAMALSNVQLYERLQETVREAEAMVRAKDEWIQLLCHELRTPLTPILGWLQLLQTQKMTEEKRMDALNSIERNLRTETRLVEDLLEASRSVSGKMKLEPAEVDLLEPIQSAVEVLKPTADTRGIAVDVHVPPSPCIVVGDKQRLQQAIWNILGNAIKFSPQSSRVDVQLQRRGDYFELAITDHGIGISPDMLPRLFKMFQQADGSATRVHGGLGLGLALTRHLVELHGGRIEAQSDGVGHGATFRLYLPCV
jgi:two-component system CheB/CheR fusion protein